MKKDSSYRESTRGLTAILISNGLLHYIVHYIANNCNEHVVIYYIHKLKLGLGCSFSVV
jgi:hypothetical protein